MRVPRPGGQFSADLALPSASGSCGTDCSLDPENVMGWAGESKSKAHECLVALTVKGSHVC